MLHEVARQQAEWIEQGWKVVPISVNVSRAHFTREDLAEHICEIVDQYHVPHNVIELELTESAFFDDKQVLLNTVRKLRDAGFSVSMDDFGAGYSSLNSLKELSIDVLKIDADFFRGANSLDRGMLIVSEVIDLAKKLNMKIVAEGIECREQVDFLTDQECDLIQGYYLPNQCRLGNLNRITREYYSCPDHTVITDRVMDSVNVNEISFSGRFCQFLIWGRNFNALHKTNKCKNCTIY